MSFLRGQVGRGESMGGGPKKEEPYCDGIRKHRFLALAQPNAVMTCFLKPVASHRWNDMLSEACDNLKNT